MAQDGWWFFRDSLVGVTGEESSLHDPALLGAGLSAVAIAHSVCFSRSGFRFSWVLVAGASIEINSKLMSC